MLLIYDRTNGEVVSISGYLHEPFSKEEVDSITLVEPIPPEQGMYRIYDAQMAKRIWSALDQGCTISVLMDEEGNPIDVRIDGDYKEPLEPPTLEERVSVLEELELMRLFGGDE